MGGRTDLGVMRLSKSYVGVMGALNPTLPSLSHPAAFFSRTFLFSHIFFLILDSPSAAESTLCNKHSPTSPYPHPNTGAPSASSSIVAGKVRPTLSHQISADSPHYSDGCCDSPRSAGRPGTSSCSRRGDDRDRDRDRESRDGHRDRDRDSRDGRESLREERGSLREERGSLRDERASLPDRDRGERGERGERRASSRLSDRVDPGPTSTTTASSVPSISDRERDLLASERERLERERELLVREKELLREKEKMLKEKEKQEKKQTSRGRSPSGERPGERSGDRDSGSRRSSQRHSSESKYVCGWVVSLVCVCVCVCRGGGLCVCACVCFYVWCVCVCFCLSKCVPMLCCTCARA